MQLPCCCHAVAMQLQDFVHISCRTGKGIAVRQLPCCCHAVAILVNNSLLHGHTQWAVQRGEGGVSKHGYVIATKPFLNDGGVIGHQ